MHSTPFPTSDSTPSIGTEKTMPPADDVAFISTEVDCGGFRNFAPSCDECPQGNCGGECAFYGRCIDIATIMDFNCRGSIRPQKEFAEGCVTNLREDMNSCMNGNTYYDDIWIGDTVCGRLSSYCDESSSCEYRNQRYIRSDKDFFRLTLPVGGVGKVKIKLELTGDSFDAFIQIEKMKQDNVPCGDTDYRLGYKMFPSSYNPIIYELTADNLDEGDSRITVYATNLASNPMECGSGEVYSYKLSVTQIDKTCIRNGSDCGTWRLGAGSCGHLRFRRYGIFHMKTQRMP